MSTHLLSKPICNVRCSESSAAPKEPEYVIVKYAAKACWSLYFMNDPKVTGVKINASAVYTYAGKAVEIQPAYRDLELAKKDLARVLLVNPSGGYAICPLRE